MHYQPSSNVVSVQHQCKPTYYQYRTSTLPCNTSTICTNRVLVRSFCSTSSVPYPPSISTMLHELTPNRSSILTLLHAAPLQLAQQNAEQVSKRTAGARTHTRSMLAKSVSAATAIGCQLRDCLEITSKGGARACFEGHYRPEVVQRRPKSSKASVEDARSSTLEAMFKQFRSCHPTPGMAEDQSGKRCLAFRSADAVLEGTLPRSATPVTLRRIVQPPGTNNEEHGRHHALKRHICAPSAHFLPNAFRPEGN